jgi:hypothetical protein
MPSISKQDQVGAKKRSITQINKSVNRKLKKLYMEKEITACEICNSTSALSWHHRHKRREYAGDEKLLCSLQETILVCQDHHEILEYDRSLTRIVFNYLRR